MADDRSELDRIREADIANILAKVKAGKTLTATEDERLQKYYAAVDTRVADSMSAASAMSGMTEKDLERAKAAGCPAFRGSRVYIGELLTWWKENGDSLPTGNSELDLIAIEIQREKLRKLQFENAVTEGKYGEIAKLVPSVEGLARDTLAIVRRVLEDEAPRRLAGKSEEELRGLLPVLVDEICELTEEKLKEWAKPKS
jgi:hypothetical protein